jgi:phage major head subunit gpT-like protein
MPIDIAELNQIEKLVRDEFGKAFSQAPVSYQLYTSEIVDTESITPFEWIGALPRVREWIGARHIEDMKNYDYTIKKKDWELTIRVPYRKMWESSKTMLAAFVIQRVSQLGTQFRKDYPSEIVVQALENGTSNLAYDGVPFFADSGRANVNLKNGSGTTVDNLITDIETCRAAMKKFKDDKGRTLNITGDVAVIPPELEIKFMEITRARLRDGSDNVHFGSLEYVVDARLTDTSDWYFIASNEFIKPLLFVSLGGVNVAVKDTTFDNKSLTVGADATGNVGYSFPELAIKVVNS